MLIGLIIAAVGVVLSSPVFGQLPPPPPEVWKAQLAFFSALPDRLPVTDTTAFEALIADDVQVFRDGALIHRTRTDWMKELRSYRQSTPEDPQGFYISRDNYTVSVDGIVSVREFTSPVPSEGNLIIYHLGYPMRQVSYQFADGKLVRVDYGQAMSKYTNLCREVVKAKGATDLGVRRVCG